MDNGQKGENVIVKFKQIEFISVKAIKTENNQQYQNYYGK